MKTFRLISGILMILPALMFVDAAFLHIVDYGTGSIGELVYLVFGITILTLNFWAWVYPEVIEFYFFGQDPGSMQLHLEQERIRKGLSQAGQITKSKNFPNDKTE